jgi:hypothetical protein
MRINSQVSMHFQGYNDSIEIKLPAEAENAATFPADLLAGGEASPVSQTGNESMTDESVINQSTVDESAQNASVSQPVQDQIEIPAANQTSLENNSIQAAA